MNRKKQLIDLAVGVIVGDMGDWTAVHVQAPSLPEAYPRSIIDVIEVDDTATRIMGSKEVLEAAILTRPPNPRVRR